jgi:hypothetical protein
MEFWTAIRRWFRDQRADAPPLQAPDGSLATSPAERAHAFANHLERALGGPQDPAFDEAFRQETEASVSSDTNLEPLTLDDSEDPDDNAIEEDEPTRPVTSAEVHRSIRRLHSGKAPGLDGLSSDIVRHCPPALSTILARIISASFRLGWIPARWRRSIVRMLPKAGKPLSAPSDFRPIALCPVLGKLAERIFARRLLSVCQRQHLLPPEQSAFRPGRDTTEQVALLVQRVGQSLNSNLATTLIALDANKAFDSVWHAGLLRCLDEHKLSCPTRRWVAAFLRDRQASVLEDGSLSRTFATAAGVPQGSPLSPLLYILYTATMPLPRGRLLGASVYADDVALWASARTPTAALQRLRPTLHQAVMWGRRWRITFNPAKTQVGYFSRLRSSTLANDLPPPRLMGAQLSWARHVDLLGVRLDRRLSFTAHARRLTQRLGPRIADLRRWAWTYRSVPRWVGAMLAKTLLRPAYSYAAPVLELACTSARDTLQRLENRCLRAGLRHSVLLHPVNITHAAAGVTWLQPHLIKLGCDFLRRAAETRHHRLLSAFCCWAPRVRRIAWHGTLLERLFHHLDDSGRSAVREARRRRRLPCQRRPESRILARRQPTPTPPPLTPERGERPPHRGHPSAARESARTPPRHRLRPSEELRRAQPTRAGERHQCRTPPPELGLPLP